MAAIKPNFLIAGASKAGTTSLHEYLAQHPDIFMSSFKEPNYFVPGYGYEKWEDYLALFRGARNQKAIGESSTGYLYCDESPPWIKSTLDPVKIILMLRNPAPALLTSTSRPPSFANALERESSRARDPEFRANCPQFFPDYLYYATGLYSEQVERFLETFGPDSVRIYLFEEFAADPRATCHEIFEFLGVDPDFEPTIAIHNEGRLPASPRLQFWLRSRAPRYLRFLPARFRRAIVDRSMTLNTRRGSTPQRDLESEQQLLERYRADIRKLEQLLGRDLSIWLHEQTVAAPASDYVSLH